MAAPAVEVINLSKRFFVRHERLPSIKRLFTRMLRPFPTETVWALHEVGLNLAPGEAIGIVGRNGSGKSTLLRIIAGIIVPTSGAIVTRGLAAGLFELAAGFHPELSGFDNVRLVGALMGHTPKEVAAQVDDIVAFSELEEFIDVPVKSYSSGMALRLGFSIAVAFQPRILLVDEVLAVADAHFQNRVYNRLRELQEAGSAVILVAHDMSVVREMCARTVWLDGGRLRADGDTDEVIEEYLSEAV